MYIVCSIYGYGIELFYGRLSDDKMFKKVEIYVGNDGICVFSINYEFDLK